MSGRRFNGRGSLTGGPRGTKQKAPLLPADIIEVKEQLAYAEAVTAANPHAPDEVLKRCEPQVNLGKLVTKATLEAAGHLAEAWRGDLTFAEIRTVTVEAFYRAWGASTSPHGAANRSFRPSSEMPRVACAPKAQH